MDQNYIDFLITAETNKRGFTRIPDFKGLGSKYANSMLARQKHHDLEKKQYVIDNNIRLLEIWYYSFDNIEEILKKELNL